MTLMFRKEVQAITVAYKDGEIETYHPIDGTHIARRGYDKGLPNPGPAHIEHSIQWRGKAD